MPVPYSDNLYSADDSDIEADALSPSDGYFHASSTSDAASSSTHRQLSSNVPFVPNVLVEDPSLSGSKAREAEAERLNSSAEEVTGPSRIPRPVAHQHRRSVEEDPEELDLNHPSSSSRSVPNVTTPLFPRQVDAPPAYSPSPASPMGYQTFTASSSTMGLPEEQQRLIPRGPESMAPSPPEDPKPTFWERVKASFNRFRTVTLRRKLRTILGVLVILSIFSILLGSFGIEAQRKKSRGPVDNVPVTNPDMDNSDLIWKPIQGCLDHRHKFQKISSTIDFHYQRNITIIQTVDREDQDHTGWSPNVWGSVVLRPTTGNSPGSIDLEVISNHEDLHPTVEFDENTQQVRISTPRKIKWGAEMAPCIQVRVTLWVPLHSALNAFEVGTIHLDIQIKEGLIMGALNGAVLHTMLGDIEAPKPVEDKEGIVPYTLDSRRIHIETISGQVTGWYPLYDLLDIQTASGDVDVDVTPKLVNPQNPQPANLQVRSVSGDITVREPLDHAIKAEKPDKAFPPRDYVVRMATASGDIKADVAVGSEAKFESQSGDLTLRLWPVLDSGLLKTYGKKPFLSTDTKSGDTKLDLLSPLWTSLATIGEAIPPLKDHDPYHKTPLPNSPPVVIIDPDTPSLQSLTPRITPALSLLKSRHSSISGNIALTYPSEWEGILFAQTISGSQNIRGEGLEVTKSGSLYLKHVKGRKGRGYSDLTVDTVSGDQDVLIGKSET